MTESEAPEASARGTAVASATAAAAARELLVTELCEFMGGLSSQMSASSSRRTVTLTSVAISEPPVIEKY